MSTFVCVPGVQLPSDDQLLNQHPDLLHLRQQVQDHLPPDLLRKEAPHPNHDHPQV